MVRCFYSSQRKRLPVSLKNRDRESMRAVGKNFSAQPILDMKFIVYLHCLEEDAVFVLLLCKEDALPSER